MSAFEGIAKLHSLVLDVTEEIAFGVLSHRLADMRAHAAENASVADHSPSASWPNPRAVNGLGPWPESPGLRQARNAHFIGVPCETTPEITALQRFHPRWVRESA